jgi:hypothetical protein
MPTVSVLISGSTPDDCTVGGFGEVVIKMSINIHRREPYAEYRTLSLGLDHLSDLRWKQAAVAITSDQVRKTVRGGLG